MSTFSWINLKIVILRTSTDTANDYGRISPFVIILLEEVKRFQYHTWQKKNRKLTTTFWRVKDFHRIVRLVSESSCKIHKTSTIISKDPCIKICRLKLTSWFSMIWRKSLMKSFCSSDICYLKFIVSLFFTNSFSWSYFWL